MIRLILYIVTCMVLVSCYNAADKPCIYPNLPDANTSISTFRNHILGTHSHVIEDDVVVVGRVISSDAEDNFYRSIVVDDGTGAVEVMAAVSPLSSDYPEGLQVALRLQWCYATYQRGVIAVGERAESYEGYGVGYLASKEAIDRVVVRGVDVEVQEPRSMAIADLMPSDCGRLVRIDGVRLVASTSIDTLAGDMLSDAHWRGYSLFKNRDGDSIAVYTRDYARFADEHIPMEELSICGIVEWAAYNGGRECYQLKMRYAKDCTY